MKRGYFITGTDTGVGKTFVTCELARLGRSLGHRVFAFKPIETGCVGLGDDQRALVAAAGDWQTDDLRGCYQFPLPAAPSVAATSPISFDRIRQTFALGASQADLVLVEGAGGWRVPITDSTDMSTLATALGLPVIIVARATLGTINHTLLTAEAVGGALAAVILSVQPGDDLAFAESNRGQIRPRLSVPVYFHSDPGVVELVS